jgi:ABC-type amino acid transport substrate-binding protein
VRVDAPPFSYTAPDGQPAGLAVALCREVAERVATGLGLDGLGIEFVRVDARDRFPALQQGRTDLHCGPASATLSRRQDLDFSLLYFVDGAAAAVRPGTYETVFDKKAGTFGVLGGTTTENVVADLIRRNDITADVKAFKSHGDGLDALADREVDLYFGDQAILLFQIEAKGMSDDLAVMEEIFSFEPYALALKRGESGLRLAVDRALSEIYDEGLIYALILAEMGDYPLSPEARAVYQIVGLPE